MNLKALWVLPINKKKGLLSRRINDREAQEINHCSSSSGSDLEDINQGANYRISVSVNRTSRLREVLGRRLRWWQRTVRRFQARLWQELQLISAMSLAGCCFHSAAMQGSASSYQRLKRSRSDNTAGAGTGAAGSASTNPPSILLMTPDIQAAAEADDFAPHGDDSGGANVFRPAVQLPPSDDSDNTVVLKIGILGDSDTGKTSFMAKYVAVEQSQEYVETIGVASVEKIIRLQNDVNIALSIWDLGGHWQCASMLPMVCRDATAIFIMFDLTRRSTLQSVKEWFLQAREYNKAAIPVMIGTKYDCFVQMPQDIQLAMIRQARFYAQAMGASLFFSSVTHNINIHKIFKVVVAKVFDLPCNISRNLNLGEPIIDY